MREKPRKNTDPITGEPGAHPVGTGVGAAGGAITGAALGAAIGGPLGAAVGTVVGGIAAAYGAHGVAEAMNPTTEEEKYWREHHAKQPYAEKGRPYEDYTAAYRTGYEGFYKYPGKAYEEIESDLALDYERARPGGRAAVGPCPPRGACSLGQAEPRCWPARSRPRHPQRTVIIVAAVCDRWMRKYAALTRLRRATTWQAEHSYRSR